MTTGPKDPTLFSASDVRDTEIHVEEAYCSACNQSFSSDTKVCPNDGARLIKLAAERDELIGRVLEERYEIRAPLGKGGMGTVYRGWQLSVDRGNVVRDRLVQAGVAADRISTAGYGADKPIASIVAAASLDCGTNLCNITLSEVPASEPVRAFWANSDRVPTVCSRLRPVWEDRRAACTSASRV